MLPELAEQVKEQQYITKHALAHSVQQTKTLEVCA